MIVYIMPEEVLFAVPCSDLIRSGRHRVWIPERDRCSPHKYSAIAKTDEEKTLLGDGHARFWTVASPRRVNSGEG